MSDSFLEVTAPFDGTKIARLPRLNAAEMEAALAAAYGLYRNRDGWLSKARRIEILRAAAKIVAGRAEEPALQAACDGQQQAVAADEAEGGVDALEFVEVDEDHRGLHGVIALGPNDDGFQAIDEQLAIGKACQAAMHGVMQKPLVRPLHV